MNTYSSKPRLFLSDVLIACGIHSNSPLLSSKAFLEKSDDSQKAEYIFQAELATVLSGLFQIQAVQRQSLSSRAMSHTDIAHEWCQKRLNPLGKGEKRNKAWYLMNEQSALNCYALGLYWFHQKTDLRILLGKWIFGQKPAWLDWRYQSQSEVLEQGWQISYKHPVSVKEY